MYQSAQPKSATRETVRAQQRDFLERLMQLTGKPLSVLAREAKVSDSTLTRFYNNAGYAGVLSTETVQALAVTHDMPTPSDARVRATQAVQHEATVYDINSDHRYVDALRQIIAARPDAHPWRMSSDHLVLAGVRTGDIMIIDGSVTPQRGDIICVQVEAGRAAQTSFRQFDPPFAVAASLPVGAIKPLLVNGETVRIAGVMTELVRVRQ